jgi:hypothetical protein
VAAALSPHMPEHWYKKEEYRDVLALQSFLVELLTAMSGRAALITLGSIPDPAKLQGQLPPTLLAPVTTFLKSIADLEGESPVPQRVVSADDVNRLNEIMQSDLFAAYREVQSEFDDAGKPLENTMPAVVRAGQKLWTHYSGLIKLRRASLGVLELTPKLIDAVFGKLPGTFAEVGAKLGISFLEERRRIVIYEFRETVADIFRLNLEQMLSRDGGKFE